MKSDQKVVHDLIYHTIVQLCERGLQTAVSLQICGVIGVTVNDADVFVVHINEDRRRAGNSLQESNAVVEEELESSLPATALYDSHPSPVVQSAEAKKRLIFTEPDIKQENAGDCDGASDIDYLPDLTHDYIFLKKEESSVSEKRQKCASQEDEALVIVDSDEEENSVNISNSETVLLDEICSPDDDCIMAEPGVLSLHIASVTGSATKARSINEVAESNSLNSSPSLKRESLRQVVLQPVNSNGASSRNYIKASSQDDGSQRSLGYHTTQMKCFPVSAQTPPKGTNLKRRSSFIASTPPGGSADTALMFCSTTNMSHSTPRRKMPWRTGATNDSPQSITNIRQSPCFASAGARQLYRTMFVCNIGRCSRGFAYKQNLVKHQKDKHPRDR